MRNKILLLGLVVLGILICTSLVSAYAPYYYNYGTYTSGYNYYPETPVRVGGFFGASSNYIIGLRPGTYYQTPYIQRPSMYYQAYTGVRTGGWFGYRPYGYSYYYGLRGIQTFGGYGTQYPNINYMYHGTL